MGDDQLEGAWQKLRWTGERADEPDEDNQGGEAALSSTIEQGAGGSPPFTLAPFFPFFDNTLDATPSLSPPPVPLI